MDWDYDAEFRLAKLVTKIFFGTVVLFAVVAELLQSSASPVTLTPLFSEDILATVRLIFYGITAIMLVLALILKANIRRPPADGFMLRLLHGLIRNLHNVRSGSAVVLLVPVAGLLEMVAVLGMVIFVFSGGEKWEIYPFLAIALIAMLLTYPKNHEKDNLIALDREVQAASGTGEGPVA